ncbi:hypothetical protein DE4576_04949 [Mycobacterium marinum]|nr:hypothetical protein DE4576_04949 [Mycobacterium marinum]
MTSGILQSVQACQEAGRDFPLDSQELFIKKSGLHDLRLTIEADPIDQTSPLYEVISGVVEALGRLQTGVEFEPTLRFLDASLEKAVSVLEDWAGDDELTIEDIVSSLERAFLLSLIITLTSHTFLVDWDDKWKQHHQRFLDGHEPADLPHYVHIKTFIPCPAPGPGIVHIQHLHTALRAGTMVWVAGAPRTDVDNYPEYQSITYSQWFAYMHAVWDEQFRSKIAAVFSTVSRPLEKRDVVDSFFGDIRLIRNDYVHNQGIANESAKCVLPLWKFEKGRPLNVSTEQMVALIDLFPRDDLLRKPTPLPVRARVNLPGNVDAGLKEQFVARANELKLDKNAAIDQAIRMWLADTSS